MNDRVIYPLREKQVQTLGFHMHHPKGGDLSDPATGKTAPANVWMWALTSEYGAKSVFMMPTSLFKQNWRSFFKFTHFKEEEVVLLRGTPKQKAKLMANPNAKVFISSFNLFAPKPGRKEKKDDFGNVIKPAVPPGPSDYQLLRKHHKIEAVFVDEWHMGFKSIKSARTQGLLYWLQQEIPIFIPMTGTAVDGHLDSVYPLIHAIEPRYYVNHQDFLNQHATYDFWGDRIIGWKNVEKVKEILQRHCIRWSFEEVHGKDATVVIPQEFEMAPEHREAYEKYESTGMLDTPQGFVEASSGGEMVLRLRQICNHPETFAGEFGMDGWDKFELTKDEGLEIHLTTALQTNMPVLIFAAFKPEQRRLVKIAEKCGARVALLNGEVRQGKAREKIEDDFRAGLLDVVVASPDIVSVGYDWPHLRMVIFNSLDYKDSAFLQGYRRGVRGKRETPLLCYVLFYADSVEEDVMGIVEGKMELAQQTDPTRLVFELIKKRHKELKVGEPKTKAGQALRPSDMGKK